MNKLTNKANPTPKAEAQKTAHIAAKAATKAKPASANYWASLLMPMALIAVVG